VPNAEFFVHRQPEGAQAMPGNEQPGIPSACRRQTRQPSVISWQDWSERERALTESTAAFCSGVNRGGDGSTSPSGFD
jgi:hypothetical protein